MSSGVAVRRWVAVAWVLSVASVGVTFQSAAATPARSARRPSEQRGDVPTSKPSPTSERGAGSFSSVAVQDPPPAVPVVTAPAIELPAPTPPLATPSYVVPKVDVPPLPKPVRPPADPAKTVEVPQLRAANESVFRRSDGNLEVRMSSTPVNFQDSKGGWQPIDNHLVSDGDGGFVNAANSFRVSFHSMGSGGITLSAPDGDLGFVVDGADPKLQPVLSDDGLQVTYPSVVPGSDLVYSLQGGGFEESLIVRGPGSTAQVSYTVTGVGLAKTDGGLRGGGDGVASRVRISNPDTFDAAGRPVDVEVNVLTATDAATGEPVPDLSGKVPAGEQPDPSPPAVVSGRVTHVTFGVDPAWVARQPDTSFPFTVDPSVVVSPNQDLMWAYANHTGSGASYASYNDGYARTGNPGIGGANADVAWRTVVHFPFESYIGYTTVEQAYLTTNVIAGASAPGAQALAINWASQWGWHYNTTPSNGWGFQINGSIDSGVQYPGANGSGSELRWFYDPFVRNGNSGAALLLRSIESSYTAKKFTVGLTLVLNRWPTGSGSGAQTGAHSYTVNTSASDPDGDPLWTMTWIQDYNKGEFGWLDAQGTLIRSTANGTPWVPYSSSVPLRAPPSWAGDNNVWAYQYVYDGYWDPVMNEAHVTTTMAVPANVSNTLPSPATLSSPAAGGSQPGPTVTLAAILPQVTDTDNDPVSYQFYTCPDSACSSRTFYSAPAAVVVPGQMASQAITFAFPPSWAGQTFYWGVHLQDGPEPTAGHQYGTPRAFTVIDQAPTATLVSPVNRTILGAQPPTLTATVADPDSGASIQYRFVVTPLSGSGIVATSDWRPAVASGATVSWQSPDALSSGAGYTWNVEVRDEWGRPGVSSNASLVTQGRLGHDPTSPMQDVGGASVNLATGNEFVAIPPARSMSTIGGTAAVSLVYNSEDHSQQGLQGQYWIDDNTNGLLDASEVRMSRIDPLVSFNWGTAAPAPSVPADFRARWTGYMHLPALGTHSWTFAGAHDDIETIQITPAGASTPTTVFSGGCCKGISDPTIFNNDAYGTTTPLTLANAAVVKIQVDFADTGGAAYVDLHAKADGVEYQIQPSWFSTNLPTLPTGWTLSTNGGADPAWARVDVEADGVLATASDGSEAFFTKTTNNAIDAWQPPAGTDDTLVVNTAASSTVTPPLPAGSVTIHGSDGLIYLFDNTGAFHSVYAAADDLKPAGAATTMQAGTIPGAPLRATALTDRLAPTRSIKLWYQQTGLTPPGGCPTLTGFDASPPDGMLCRIDYPDTTQTRLYYKNTLLAMVSDPGDETVTTPGTSAAPEGRAITTLNWDSAGNLTSVIGPTANDRITAQDTTTNIPAAEKIASADLRLDFVYAADKPITMTARRPTVGAARPQVTVNYGTISYTTGGTSTVQVAGISGTSRTVTFDSSGRLTADQDAVGRVSTTQWSPAGDVPLWASNAGRTTSTVYDQWWHPLDAYGPAPTACFTLPATIDYATNGPAPTVTNPGCGVTQVPHSRTDYDTATSGLTAAVWNNLTRTGPTSAHRMAPGTAIEYNDTPAGAPATGWSARYTGYIVPPAAGNYTLHVYTGAGTSAALYIDDYAQANLGPNAGTDITFTITGGSTLLDPNTHRPQNLTPWKIRFDVSTTTATEHVSIWWEINGAASTQVPNSAIRPGLFNPTKVTVDDSAGTSQVPAQSVTTTRYDEGIDPSYSIATSTTADPSGLALTTATAYEAPAAGSLLRPTRKTLPAYAAAPSTADSTTYTYYPLNTTRANPCIAGSAAVDQGAMLQFSQDPTPVSGAAVQTEVVYDIFGRVVASRYVTDSAWTCTRFDARGRPNQTVYPAIGASPARTISYSYNVGGDPYKTAVTDPAGTVTTIVDALGRTTTYTDASAQTTTTNYDQAGRAVNQSGPTGVTSFTYDTVGRIVTQSLDGSVIATSTYSPDTDVLDPGNLTAINYPNGAGNAGNGTSGAFTYDTLGRDTAITWKQGAITLTSDAVARALSGRVLTDTVDGAATPTWTYTYDGAARLTRAVGSGHDYQYGFAAAGGCGTNTAAGKNTDRTTLTDNGVVTQTSCFDAADRVTSYTKPGATVTPAYDNRGRTTNLNGDTYTYDPANRHTDTVSGTITVTYTRDATNRIIARTDTATGATIKYGFTGPGDTPDITLDTTGTVTERTIGLLGGATVTKRAGGDVWSYPNVHGDVTAVANSAGVKQGATSVYNPGGDIIGGVLADNSAGNYDFGWLGQHQRGTEHATGVNTNLEMGARIYNPTLGRFLTTDPVPGGSANNYDYTNADPINGLDLDGLCWKWNVACHVAHGVAKGGEFVGQKAISAGKTIARASKSAAKTVTSRGFVAQLAAATLAAPVVAGVCVFTAGLGCAAAFVLAHAATSAVAYAVNNPKNRTWTGFLLYMVNPFNRYVP